MRSIARWLVFLLVFCCLRLSQAGEVAGKLVIFHAGSLAIPFAQLAEGFRRRYPGVEVLRETAGSRRCARKVSELGRRCDVLAVADYTVIEQLLFPEYADWYLGFAGNEMAIMYRPDSRFAEEINADNWPEVLLREGVEYGYSDPESDPCGYRTRFVWQLAERYYNSPGLYARLVAGCPSSNIRPKETDLLAMLEAGELDYLFIYRSVCEQHGLPYVALPRKINLGAMEYAEFYRQARVKVTGRRPGEWIEKRGMPMVYGITVPKTAVNRTAALAFVEFVVSEAGQKIMAQNGQPPIAPARVFGRVERLPERLAPWVAGGGNGVQEKGR